MRSSSSTPFKATSSLFDSTILSFFFSFLIQSMRGELMSDPNTTFNSTSIQANDQQQQQPGGSRFQAASQLPIPTSRAQRAIRVLDSKIFPSNRNSNASSSALNPAPKRRKVADVQAEIDREILLASKNGDATNANQHPPGSLFNKLTGLAAKRKREESERIREDQRKRIISDLKGRSREEFDSSTSSNLLSSKAASSYTPFSLPALQERISSFSLSNYSPKPPALSPLAAALAGWSNTSRETLSCSVCEESWKVESRIESSGETEGNGNDSQSMESKLMANHKDWCPWKIRGCSITMYRLPLLSTPATLSSIASNASLLQPHVSSLRIVSPLTDEELQALTSCVNASTRQFFNDSGTSDSTLSSQSILLSLFGWELIGTPSSTSSPTSTSPSTSNSRALAICKMCQRKLGLWTFSFMEEVETSHTDTSTSRIVKRPLHCEREHRTFCPVVNGEVQAGTWLISNKNNFTSKSNDLEGMRSRAASEASLAGPSQLGSETNLQQFSKSQEPLLPAWKIRLDCALGSRKSNADQNRDSVDLGGRNSETGSTLSIEKEMEMRREKSKELLAKVRKIVSGSN